MPTFSGTTASSSTIASAADLVERFDIDLISRLASDDRAPMSRADTVTHANVLTAISDAEGRFRAAVQHGSRYTLDDLAGLTDPSRDHAKRIICATAMANILGRRSGAHDQQREQLTNESQHWLDLLSAGKDVFTLTAHLDAGLAEGAEALTESERITRDLRVDRLTGHLFAHN